MWIRGIRDVNKYKGDATENKDNDKAVSESAIASDGYKTFDKVSATLKIGSATVDKGETTEENGSAAMDKGETTGENGSTIVVKVRQ